ncbi:MAG TPA: hypothetical protein VFN29_04865 [Chiayiivirga sp.]|nr:hypothetical protein [Chiayiivirga sp.]
MPPLDTIHGHAARRSRLALALGLGLGLAASAHAIPTIPDGVATMTLSPQRAAQVDRFRLMGSSRTSGDTVATVRDNRPAATHTVTSCNDSGANTLREAVAQANSGDTIDMSGLTCNINLQSSIITTTKNLTLKGDPSNAYGIRGGDLITPLVHRNETGTLTLDGMSVSFGRYTAEHPLTANGGCI